MTSGQMKWQTKKRMCTSDDVHIHKDHNQQDNVLELSPMKGSNCYMKGIDELEMNLQCAF
jgi:hypothetical protein